MGHRAEDQGSPDDTPATGAPDEIVAAIEDERRGWNELATLVGSVTTDERAIEGYYVSPDWSILDVLGHIGAWLAEGHLQLERIGAGTYVHAEVDIDAINAQLLDALHGQTWAVTWTQANAARTMLLQRLAGLGGVGEDARWWIRKAGPDHYAEHLPRLREWVAELQRRRPQPA
jgi:hypothetical protein